jgi:hypothetical protein
VCLDISEIEGKPLSDFTEAADSFNDVIIPDKKKILSILKKSGIAGGDGELLPLIIDEHDRLYFQKYHYFEKQLAESIKNMARPYSAGAYSGYISHVYKAVPGT